MSSFWPISGPPLVPRGTAKTGKAALRAVEDRLERALLACEAMWSIVRERLGTTDEELVERMNSLDVSDGRLDGKVRKQAVNCPKCKRVISVRFANCMYCGQAIVHDPFA